MKLLEGKVGRAYPRDNKWAIGKIASSKIYKGEMLIADVLKNGEEIVAKIDGKEYSAEQLYEELKGQYGYSVLMNSKIAESE